MTLEWEPLCCNWLTGRKVWAVRYLPEDVDPWEWAIVVTRSHWLSRVPSVSLVSGMTQGKRRLIQQALAEKGFIGAMAVERGRRVYWDTAGVRRL
jgi:hypothetical protein